MVENLYINGEFSVKKPAERSPHLEVQTVPPTQSFNSVTARHVDDHSRRTGSPIAVNGDNHSSLMQPVANGMPRIPLATGGSEVLDGEEEQFRLGDSDDERDARSSNGK